MTQTSFNTNLRRVSNQLDQLREEGERIRQLIKSVAPSSSLLTTPCKKPIQNHYQTNIQQNLINTQLKHSHIFLKESFKFKPKTLLPEPKRQTLKTLLERQAQQIIQNQAAIKIQKKWRAYFVFNIFKNVFKKTSKKQKARKTTPKVQKPTMDPPVKHKNKVASLSKLRAVLSDDQIIFAFVNFCATKIQSNFRRYFSRSLYLRTRHRLRAFVIRLTYLFRKYKKLKKKAKKIQYPKSRMFSKDLEQRVNRIASLASLKIQ